MTGDELAGVEDALASVTMVGPDLTPQARALGATVAAAQRAAGERTPSPRDSAVLAQLEAAQRDVLAHLEAPTLNTGALYVNVDFIELVDRYGDDQAWAVLGKLKDLLG